MNTETFQYDTSSPALDLPNLPNRAKLATFIEWIKPLFSTRRPEHSNQGIVNSLPIEEKLRLGMYRYMD